MTKGFVNGVPSVLFFEGSGKETTTREWAVLPISRSKPFAAAGDSGSFVLDLSSALVGMIHGSVLESIYVTPIQDLANHIKEVTGCDHVRLPGGDNIN